MPGPGGTGVDPPSGTMPPPTPIWISSRLWVALIIGSVLLLVLAVWLAPNVLTVALGGVALALILSFPVRWLSRLMPRGLAILIVLLLLLGTIALALALLIPVLVTQLSELIAAWPSIRDAVGRMLDDLADPLRERGLLRPTDQTLSDRLRQGLGDRGRAIVENVLVGVLGVASGTISFTIQLFGVLFIATYLLIDVCRVHDAFVGLVPTRYSRDAEALWDAFSTSISRYLAGMIVIAAFQGGLAALALWALGVPYAILLGAWVAVTSIIPYVGAWIGAVPAILVALTVSPATAAFAVLIYVVIQQVESTILTPRVHGQVTRVHPIVVLLTVIWAGQAFGLVGSILAVPSLVVGRVLFDFFRVRLRVQPGQRSAGS